MHNDRADTIKCKLFQLEALADLLVVGLDCRNTAVFMTGTLHNSVWLMQEIIQEIKLLFMEKHKK